MQDFINRKNIELLERKLLSANSESERRVIEKLLKEIRAKSQAIEARPPSNSS